VKKLFAFLILSIFLISSISAIEFSELDNVKSYNEETRTISYSNSILWIFPTGKVADVKLNTPSVYHVIKGEDRLVAEFTINNFEDYQGAFDNMDFYNLRGDNKKIDRKFTYKYKVLSGTQDVPYYKEVCTIQTKNNSYNSCVNEIAGYNKKSNYRWEILDEKGILPKGEITIGVFTDVSSGERIEWIPTFFGVRSPEFAVWTEDFNVNLSLYFNFEDSLQDTIRGGLVNYTRLSGASVFNATMGLHGNAIYVDDSNEMWLNATGWANNESTTINFWVNGTIGGDKVFADALSGTTGGSGGYVAFNGLKTRWNICDTVLGAANWNGGFNMYTIIYNSTGTHCYLNGALDASTATKKGFYGIGHPYLGVETDGLYLDEVAIWNNRSLPENMITDLYNVGTGIFYELVSPLTLSVNLTFPSNNSLISDNNITFNATYTFSNMNITNGTNYIWYSNGTLFNKTTEDILPSLNYSSLNIGGFTLGNYYWNVYGCGINTTDMICSWGNKGNYSFNIAGVVLNENYSQLTYETASERFLVNFSLFPGANFISVYLNHNGTDYIVSDITNYGSSLELKRTIDIPLNKDPYINETKQFYWSFIFSNGGLVQQNTTNKNQTILPLNINYCNTTYQKLGINFTTYDETNPNPLINSTFHTFWRFWSGDGTIKKNYSFEDTSVGNSSFKFCISPNQSVMKTNLDSEITSPGFFPRTYYLSNASINNVTQEVPIRMINTSLGVKFFHTIRKGVERINGAIVIISKFDVGLGLWVTVGIRQSDDDGIFIEYLELDKEYTYSIKQNGVFLGNIQKTSTCTATPCLMNLDIESGAINLWEGYYDEWAPDVIYNLTFDKTTKNVTYTFIDTTGLANNFRLQVNKLSANETGELLCNKTLVATLGELKCELSGQTGQFVAKGYVARSPEKVVAFLYGILNALTEIIGKNEGLFFTLLLVLVVGLIGAYNPVIGVLLAGLAFVFAGIMGFLMISMTAIVLVVLLIIILIIKMGRQGV
jgi:hypothetical protein